MKVYAFTVKMHEEYGTLGFSLDGRGWADPVMGMGVAHDVLEHFPHDDGSTEHELAALGASLFVRNECEYYAAKGQHAIRPYDNIASDFPSQAYYLRDAGRDTLRKAPRHRRAEAWVEEEFGEVYRKGRNLCRDDEAPSEWLRDRAAVIGWMRHGYVMAQRRYKESSPSEVCSLFMEIERMVEGELRNVYEGMRYKLRVDAKRMHAELEEVAHDYD